MHHVLGDVAAGELPEQAPVDEPVWIEVTIGPAVEESLPVHVLRSAVGGDWAHPLSFAMRRVAAHP